ncbi:hypothetical protein EVAR_88938_1 [Eumeta japonica]|uniref:Uncharacterized protein n=1 Tax=Eumeta variegata TaxID=151549 RepID=A0A4C1VR85_EUMVA|nr:hypothetical protein EVAR_88938_1 [Eumeta japonica]
MFIKIFFVTTTYRKIRQAVFTKYTVHFDGSASDPDVLETFLDAIEVYKKCLNINDEHALRGLPILLTGNAAAEVADRVSAPGRLPGTGRVEWPARAATASSPSASGRAAACSAPSMSHAASSRVTSRPAGLPKDPHITASRPIESRSKHYVLCALHFFASGSYQRALATGHCVSQQALSKYIKEVTDALTNISERYIQFPNTTQERNAVKHQCCFIKFIFYKGLCKIDEGMMRDMNAQNRQLQEIILQLLSRGIDLLEGFAQNR